jgi:hypothetical protein
MLGLSGVTDCDALVGLVPGRRLQGRTVHNLGSAIERMNIKDTDSPSNSSVHVAIRDQEISSRARAAPPLIT